MMLLAALGTILAAFAQIQTYIPPPTNCAEWYAQTQGHGPSVNGVSGIWQCYDTAGGGYVITWPGNH